VPRRRRSTRQALRLRPEYPEASYNLGRELYAQEKYAEAEAEYRQTLRLRPDFPEALVNLGLVLAEQRKFVEAEAMYGRRCSCGQTSLKPTLPHRNLAVPWRPRRSMPRRRPSTGRRCASSRRRFCHRPPGNVLSRQGKHAAAAHFFAEVFAAEPKLADDLGTSLRYTAARCATLAGCGQSPDAATLDETARAQLRQQALQWLREDLTAWGQLLEKEDHEDSPGCSRGCRSGSWRTIWLECGVKHWGTLPEVNGNPGSSCGPMSNRP